MTRQDNCAVAERLAGAIAIGEAGETERDAYRSHVSGCARCLHDLGGEREIERVMGTIARARDDERWEPDRRVTLIKRHAPRTTWTLATALAAAIALVVGVRVTEKPQAVAPPQRTISMHDARALAALDTQTAPRREGRAESLAVGAATFSTAFDVTVDARGTPLRCTITKSSGDRALDQSVCGAAMHARYSPQSSKGR
jgi:hypothetical protein